MATSEGEHGHGHGRIHWPRGCVSETLSVSFSGVGGAVRVATCLPTCDIVSCRASVGNRCLHRTPKARKRK